MAKKIKVTINTKTIEIDSDSPSFNDLVSTVIENKEFDYKNISVECEDDDKFDKDSFKDALVSVIESILDNLKIQDEKLDEKIGTIQEEKDKLDK